jgi:hypothetical protein
MQGSTNSDNGGVTNALFATGARSEAERKESGGVALGAKPPASNGPYRAGKGSLYEGGDRVPAFANWPGKLKPAVVDEPLSMVDVMPTLLVLAGGKGADDHPFDGKNIWPSLTDGEPSPHDELLINVEAIRGAIRKGEWKLVRLATLPGKTELLAVMEVTKWLKPLGSVSRIASSGSDTGTRYRIRRGKMMNIDENVWYTAPADPGLVFDDDRDKVWEHATAHRSQDL